MTSKGLSLAEKTLVCVLFLLHFLPEFYIHSISHYHLIQSVLHLSHFMQLSIWGLGALLRGPAAAANGWSWDFNSQPSD